MTLEHGCRLGGLLCALDSGLHSLQSMCSDPTCMSALAPEGRTGAALHDLAQLRSLITSASLNYTGLLQLLVCP